MPRQTSVQLTEATEQQVANLQERGFGRFTDIVRIAIDRMYREEHIMEMKPYIKIQFSDDSLWGSDDPESGGYDEKASAEKYAEMIEAALRGAYPNARITVIRGLNDRTEIYDTEGLPDSEERPFVDDIIGRVYHSWEWCVDAN